MTAAAAAPSVLAVDRDRIPELLTGLNRWVTWSAGLPKASGKFVKVPINVKTGKPANANDRANWVSFEDACVAYEGGACSGIGLALCDQPVTQIDGQPAYLVALDLDHCADRGDEVRQLRKTLGCLYIEVSPSGGGLRMLALSRELVKGGNAGGGREVYSTGRFVTVTGNSGHGELIDATEGLKQLQREWFPPRVAPRGVPSMLAHLISAPQPEMPIHIERVKAQLACVSPDCSYERWRGVVWSVLSSGWTCAEAIARQWSQGAPHRFDSQAFEQLCRSFQPARGISLGTLAHWAREGGWQPVAAAPTATPPQGVSNVEGRPMLLTRADLQAQPPLEWLIRDVMPAKGVAAVYGPSGSGKTFLALDLVCAISSGVPHWFGAKVKPAPVVYVALEGQAGIKGRLAAWETQNNRQVPDTTRFMLGSFTLLKPVDAQRVAAEVLATIGAGAVVVVDTLNQSAPGADENASADMGRVIANAKALADAVDGLVLLIHHAGKDAARGMRGHSSLFAAMDAVIEVTKDKTGRAWRLSKVKDGDEGVPRGFDLAFHVVGNDEDGDEIRSCAVVPAVRGKAEQLKPPTGRHQKPALQVLSSLAATHPNGIPLPTAIAAVGAALDCPDERRHVRAMEAVKGLTGSGHLQQGDDGVIFAP